MNLQIRIAVSVLLFAGAFQVAFAEEGPSGPRLLTLDDTIALAQKNSRDIEAAKERLRGLHTDVERAVAAMLPTLNFQGKMTINEPEVSLTLDQSGSVFSSAFQAAQIADLKSSSGNTGLGPSASQLFATYCQNSDPNRSIPAGVQQACNNIKAPSLKDLDASINGANIKATIVPRVQLEGILALNMPLIVPSAYPLLKGARYNFSAQEKQLEATVVQVLTTVATAFYSAAGNDELVGARRHAIDVAQKTLDNAKVRLAAGVVNKVEVTRAALALLQAQQRLLEAHDTQASAYRMLATLLRIEATSFKVVPPAEPNTELLSEDRLIDQAMHQRPELLSADLQVSAYKQQAFSSLLRWTPTLSLFGNIRLTNATAFAGRIDSYALGLQLDWLIFDGFGRDAQRHAIESQQRELSIRLAQQRATITDDVIVARRAVHTKKQGMETAARSAQMAQETLELVRTQYQAGTATQLDLLNAQDVLVQAEVGVAQARFDLSLSVLNLRRLTGDTLSNPK